MVQQICYAYNFTHLSDDEESLNATIKRSQVNSVDVGVYADVWNLVPRTQQRINYWREEGKSVSVTLYACPNNADEDFMYLVCSIRNITVLFIDCEGEYYIGIEDWINRFNEIAKENGLVFGIYHGDGLIGADKVKINSDVVILVENLYMEQYLELPNPLWMELYVTINDPDYGTTTGAYLKALYNQYKTQGILNRFEAIWLFPFGCPNWELNSDQIEAVKYMMGQTSDNSLLIGLILLVLGTTIVCMYA